MKHTPRDQSRLADSAHLGADFCGSKKRVCCLCALAEAGTADRRTSHEPWAPRGSGPSGPSTEGKEEASHELSA